MNSQQDPERTIEFEFVRATENAALATIHHLGRGNKEEADAAACDAIYGVFDLVDIRAQVVIGEGIKDDAPGIFMGEKLGTCAEGSPRFDIALDPIDGTSNVGLGLPNSISVISAAQVGKGTDVHHAMRNIPTFYCEKMAYGPHVVEAIERGLAPISLDDPLEVTLNKLAAAQGKRVAELTIVTLNRPRNQHYIDAVRRAGAALRLITDGDVTAAIAPSLDDSGIDLYVGIGGSPEGILTAGALKALGGELLLRMWPSDKEREDGSIADIPAEDLARTFSVNELVQGDSSIFCATGISDSPLLPGVKLIGPKAITHSILMRARSRTVRYIRAVHDLRVKTIHLRSTHSDRSL